MGPLFRIVARSGSHRYLFPWSIFYHRSRDLGFGSILWGEVFWGSLLGDLGFLLGVILGVVGEFAYQKKMGMDCGCGGFCFSTNPLRNSLLIRERRKSGSVALCGGDCGGKNWGKEISPHKG
jgi:hypothetical protein